MGRKPSPRIDGKRLKQAMEIKRIEPLQLALIVFPHSKEPTEKEKKSLSSRIHRMGLPAESKYSLGVDEVTLQSLAMVLDVSEDWLLGAPVFMNDAEKQAFEDRKEEIFNQQFREHIQEMRQSPVFALVKDYLGGTIFCAGTEDIEAKIEVSFKENPRTFYTITPATLQMIEHACLDLCCSLIRHGSERDRILTTLED